MTAALPWQELRPGLADPVLDAQGVFRDLLTALSYPGRPVTLRRTPADPPAPLVPATAAVALTLFDLDTPVFLDAAAAHPAVTGYLRFHAGCPLTADPAAARFAVIAAAEAMPPLGAFALGEPDYPDRSATVIVQIAGFTGGAARRLTGPGIRDAVTAAPAGLAPRFWADWAANGEIYPRGVDVILAAGDAILGLPRTTRAEG